MLLVLFCSRILIQPHVIMPWQIKIWHFCPTVQSAVLLQTDLFCSTKRTELPNGILNVFEGEKKPEESFVTNK